jgi:hypothetical protein
MNFLIGIGFVRSVLDQNFFLELLDWIQKNSQHMLAKMWMRFRRIKT